MTDCNLSHDSYDSAANGAVNSLHNYSGKGSINAPAWTRQAVAITAIPPNQKGRVHFQGSDWPARSILAQSVAPGETIYVRYRRNLTLYVGPKPD
ncbi:MAG: NfeD family protein [Elainellaceae cyanobacterium]